MHAQEKLFNTNCSFFQLPYFDDLVIEKINKCPEQNKLDKTACLKNALYVTGIFQYHVTNDVSVYAIDRHKGYYSLFTSASALVIYVSKLPLGACSIRACSISKLRKWIRC